MKTHIAELVNGDLAKNTMTFDIQEPMVVKAGIYAIVPIDDYKKLVNGADNKTEKALAINGVLNCKTHPKAVVIESGDLRLTAPRIFTESNCEPTTLLNLQAVPVSKIVNCGNCEEGSSDMYCGKCYENAWDRGD